MAKKLEDYVISIPDFPMEGIIFRDVTGVIRDPEGLRMAIDTLTMICGDVHADLIAGPEARGFIFGVPLAYKLGLGFIPIRKKGKLPRETVEETYTLEYGTATVEIHKDDIKPGQRVVLVDDLLATGGTCLANIKLIESLGGVVEKVVCLIELAGLKGRELLKGYDVISAIKYEG
ncbi:MAG: adenine phosphoribosyltransferase, partial [Lachnospiraceae bacterium]|nr:adenine phosphoribosyltransferase [Lachnospiraceae bacterium]